MADLGWVPGVAIGMGGLTIAGLSLWFSYRDRTSRLREMLYERKAQACQELLTSLWTIRSQAWSAAAQSFAGVPLNETARKQIGEILKQNAWQIFATQHGQSLFVSNEVARELRDFVRVVLALSCSSAEEAERLKCPVELVHSKNARGELDKAFHSVCQVMRRSLGVEPLEEEILKLLQ